MVKLGDIVIRHVRDMTIALPYHGGFTTAFHKHCIVQLWSIEHVLYYSYALL